MVNQIEDINPFLVNIPFLNPLKTSENRNFSDVFKGFRNEILTGNGLIAFPAVYGKKDQVP